MLAISSLLLDDTTSEDLIIPGHQNLLRIHPDGIHGRQGHTETSSHLVRLAGYSHSAVLCEIMNRNGMPMNYDELCNMSSEHNIKLVNISSIMPLLL